MSVAKIDMQVMEGGSDAQYFRTKFKFINNDSFDITDLDHYRVVMHISSPYFSGDMTLTDFNSGWDKGAWYAGSLDLQDGTERIYDSSTHPASIASGKKFSTTLMFRLKPNGMASLPSGNFIAGLNTKWNRNHNYWPITSTGDEYYKLGYSYNTGASYASDAHYILEYNATSTGMLDTGWQVVTEYSSSSTVDPDTGVHPYAVDSSYFQVVTDHYYLKATESTFVDSAHTASTHSAPNALSAYEQWWDGGALSTRRPLWKFDMSSLSGKTVLDTTLRVGVYSNSKPPDESDGTKHASGYDFDTKYIDLYEPGSTWSAASVTWSSQPSVGTVLDSYVGPSDASIYDTYLSPIVSTSYVTSLITNNKGFGLKMRDEASGDKDHVDFRSNSDTQPPVLIVHYSGSTPPVTSNAKMFMVF